MKIVIPALDRHNYRDLKVLLTSIQAYNDDFCLNTLVFYKGRHPGYVGLLEPPRTEYIKQSSENRHFGDACRQIVAETGQEDLFFVNDDTVFTPTTVAALSEDLEILRKNRLNVGLVGLRTNFSAGIQNIRTPYGTLNGMKYAMEDSIVETDTVYGTAFYASRNGLHSVSNDWTKIQWYGDNLLSWDLKRAGFRNFVSRSYCHHHGSQSGTDYSTYDREGKEWLKMNRPDFFKTL